MKVRDQLTVFTIALLARLPFFLFLRPRTWAECSYGSEAGNIARSLALGNGFTDALGIGASTPTAWLGPIVPLWWAALFRTTGLYSDFSLFLVTFVDLLLSSATTIVLYEIVSRLLKGSQLYTRKNALLVTVLCSLTPESLRAIVYPWYTIILTFFFALAFLATLQWYATPTVRRSITVGSLAGLTALVSPNPLPFFGIVALLLCIRLSRREGIWRALKPLLVSGAVGAIFLTPWTIRNFQVFHRLVPIRATFGVEFLQGNNVEGGTPVQISTSVHPYLRASERRRYLELGELGYSLTGVSEASDWIEHHPLTFLSRTAERISIYWLTDLFDPYPWRSEDSWRSISIGQRGWRALLGLKAALFAAALLFFLVQGRFRRNPYALVLLLLLAVYPLPYYVTIVHPTHTILIQPYLTMMIGLGFIGLISQRNIWNGLPTEYEKI